MSSNSVQIYLLYFFDSIITTIVTSSDVHSKFRNLKTCDAWTGGGYEGVEEFLGLLFNGSAQVLTPCNTDVSVSKSFCQETPDYCLGLFLGTLHHPMTQEAL